MENKEKNSFEVIRKRIKNIILKVSIDGTVKVSAPYGVSEKAILDFVNLKLEWIEIQQKKMIEKTSVSQNELIENNQLMILGDKYTLKKEISNSKKGIAIQDNEAILYAKDVNDESEINRIVTLYNKKMLMSILSDRVPKWETVTGLKCSSWQIREMKTRWGSCNVKTRKVWFNLQLATKKIECIDYIIVHELGHILYPNHGAEFKAYQTKYLPNWKETRKLLNK